MKTINDFNGTKDEFCVSDSKFGVQIMTPEKRIIANIQGDIFLSGEERHLEELANAKLFAASKDLLKELIHLVRLLEPLEMDGRLDVPGLATLNGARKAIDKAL